MGRPEKNEGRRRMHRVKGAIQSLNSEKFERLIHERMRLGIVSALAVNRDGLSFNELRDLLDCSDGNLSVHARKLEEAGYLDCEKGYEGRIPRTTYRLTKAGRAALDRYLGHMEAVIDATRGEDPQDE